MPWASSPKSVSHFIAWRALGTLTLRELECFRVVFVVNNTLFWKEAGLVIRTVTVSDFCEYSTYAVTVFDCCELSNLSGYLFC